MPSLTGIQLLILDLAAQRPDGAVLPLPADVDLQGRARAIVLKSLLDRDLIERIPPEMVSSSTSGHTNRNYRITPEGRRALMAAGNK